MRWAAVEALEILRDERAKDGLIVALSSSDADARLAAARAVAPLADAEVLTRLLDPPPGHPWEADDRGVRTVMRRALAFSFWDRPLAQRRLLAPTIAALGSLDLAESIEPTSSLRPLACALYGRVLPLPLGNPVLGLAESVDCSAQDGATIEHLCAVLVNLAADWWLRQTIDPSHSVREDE